MHYKVITTKSVVTSITIQFTFFTHSTQPFILFPSGNLQAVFYMSLVWFGSGWVVLDSTYEGNHYNICLSLSDLFHLAVLLSSMHIVSNDKISFFYTQVVCIHCIYYCTHTHTHIIHLYRLIYQWTFGYFHFLVIIIILQ